MRREDILAFLLFFLSGLFPGICLLSRLFHYTLIISNGIGYVIGTSVFFFVLGILLMKGDRSSLRKLPAVLLSICPLLNQISVLFILFYTDNLIAVLLQASWLLITIPLVSQYAHSAGLKIAFFVLAGVLAVPILFILPWIGFGSRTVLAFKTSPDCLYCAEVIESDEGALGGSTKLQVYRKDQSFSICSFFFRKDQKELSSGSLGTFESLSWLDGETLSLNGRNYDVAAYYLAHSSEKSRILRYVSKNESRLLSCIEQNDFSTFDKDAIIREIRVLDKCIDFSCGGEGFGPDTSYWGFYYAEKHDMTALFGRLPAGQMFQKSGSGYLWKESWYDPKGDDSYYVEQIAEHFFYYEMDF